MPGRSSFPWWRFGVAPSPTQSPIEIGVCAKERAVLAPERLAGADEERRALELLARQEPEGVAHQRGDAAAVRPPDAAESRRRKVVKAISPR